ncbi:MAG: hypothetical protein PUP91_06965 [Rhizonema sp. PD37]|nr:hypothetical protein [Rhizonema sp. PD37]
MYKSGEKINLGALNVPSRSKRRYLLSKNGNGHRDFWNPVKIFLRRLLRRWEKTDKVSGEFYLIDSETVLDDLSDVAEHPKKNSDSGP